MSICPVCDKQITKSSPGVTCSGFCDSSYHANSTCSDINKTQVTALNMPGVKWTCRACRGSAGTRTRSTADGDGAALLLDAPAASELDFPGFVQSMKKEMELLRQSVDFCSNKISDFETKLSKFNDLFKVTETLKTENSTLKNKVAELSDRMISLEQFNRSYNIEIQDIPEKPDENLLKIATDIGNMFNHRLEMATVDNVFRVPTQVAGKPKNIIIRFLSKIQRDRFLAAAKTVKRSLRAGEGLSLAGISNRFYINEHLAPQTKLLLKQAKESAKIKNYKFVWIQNGSVLMRKEERSKIIPISRREDLSNL